MIRSPAEHASAKYFILEKPAPSALIMTKTTINNNNKKPI
jgi:hypothetical protein